MESARAGGFATRQLHHHQGHDRVYRADGSPATTRREALDAESAARKAAKGGAAAAVKAQPVAECSVADMMIAYRTEISTGRHAANQARYGIELLRWLGPNRPVASIDEPLISQYIAWAREQPVMIWHGGNRKAASLTPEQAARLWKPTANGRKRDDATINRYLDALRKALKIAGKARDATGRLLVANPAAVRMLAEGEALPNPIPDAGLRAIVEQAPPYLADGAALAAMMPFRKAELWAIRLKQIGEQRRGVRLSRKTAKGKRDEFLWANEAAWEIITRRRAEARRLGLPWLFWWVPAGKDAEGRPRLPKPLKNPKRSWASACRKAGLEGRYRFHDTKATFSTAVAHVAADRVTQDLSQHRSAGTTARYVKIADKAKREALQAISRRFAGEIHSPPRR